MLFLILVLASCSGIKTAHSSYTEEKNGDTYYHNTLYNFNVKYPGDFVLKKDSLSWKDITVSRKIKNPVKKEIRRNNAEVLFLGKTDISPFYNTIGLIYYDKKNKGIFTENDIEKQVKLTNLKKEYVAEKSIDFGNETVVFITSINKETGYTKEDFFEHEETEKIEKTKKDRLIIELDAVSKSLTGYGE